MVSYGRGMDTSPSLRPPVDRRPNICLWQAKIVAICQRQMDISATRNPRPLVRRGVRTDHLPLANDRSNRSPEANVHQSIGQRPRTHRTHRETLRIAATSAGTGGIAFPSRLRPNCPRIARLSHATRVLSCTNSCKVSFSASASAMHLRPWKPMPFLRIYSCTSDQLLRMSCATAFANTRWKEKHASISLAAQSMSRLGGGVGKSIYTSDLS